MRQYSLRKREGKRVERWESEFERIVNDSRNILSMEEVRKQIAETLENNAIEQTKVSLICPLTKERIEVPARYRNCRHLQCFDLKAFLAMKAKRNFLACPICNTKIDRELTITSLSIDKFFQEILSELSSSTEAVVLSDGTYKATFSHSAIIVPEVIDDEEPYDPDNSTTLKCEVKSETGSDDDEDVEVLDSVSNFDIDNEENASDAVTQDAYISDTSMECDTHQAVDHLRNINETESETGIDVDNVDELGSISRFDIDSEANTDDAETQNFHFPDTYMAGDTNQTVHSTIGKSGTNIGGKRYKCDHCSYASNRSGNLLRHSRTHTGDKPYKCDQCSFASIQAINLKLHMRSHTGERPHKCNQCSYAAAHADDLKKHIHTHGGERPHKCNQCSYAAARANDLKKHMHSHSGEKPHKCNKCSYASAQPSNLKSHMDTHNGKKPYKCDQCSYASAKADNLKMHIRTHTGEKPFKCNKCSFACAASDGIKKHMRSHTGEKPYKCSLCSFAGTHFSDLKRHFRTHTGERPYKCNKCSYASARSSGLKLHMRTHV